MPGMLQIITYLLAVYLVVKGIAVLQVGLASSREDRSLLIVIGLVTLAICVGSAVFLVNMQDQQAAAFARAPIPR